MKKYGKIIIIVVGILVVLALLILIYFKTTFISKNEVKDIVADNMNVSSSDLYFESIDFEFDNGIYEVEVYYQNRDYEYKIDAKEGKVIYTDYRSVNTNNNQNNKENDSNSTHNFDFSKIDMNTMMKITSMLNNMNNKDDPRTNLIYSLKPYLRDSKKEKIDQYANLLNITKMADLFNKTNPGQQSHD